MSEELNAEIRAAIDKSLPAQVGQALRARLEQAEANEKALKALGDAKEQLRSQLKTCEKDLAEALELLKTHEMLAVREKKVTEREIRSDLTLLQTKFEASEKSKAELFDLMKVVFKNPTITDSVFGCRNEQNQFGGTTSMPYNDNRTRTITKE